MHSNDIFKGINSFAEVDKGGYISMQLASVEFAKCTPSEFTSTPDQHIAL